MITCDSLYFNAYEHFKCWQVMIYQDNRGFPLYLEKLWDAVVSLALNLGLDYNNIEEA